MAAPFIIVKKQQHPQCPPTDEWIDKISKAIQWNMSHRKQWITATRYNTDEPWRDMLSEWSQSQESTCYRILFMWNVRNRLIHRDSEWDSDCLGWGRHGTEGSSNWGGWSWPVKEFLWGGWKCSNHRLVTLRKYTKNHRTTWNVWILWYVKYSSIKL